MYDIYHSQVYISVADTDVGFVHSLSPIKKAKSGKLYYNFNLQTSPTKFTKVVGFDKNSHTQALHFQTTKSPAKIININENEDTIFVNHTSSIIQGNSSDVNFECLPPPTLADPNNTIPDAIDITLSELNNLSRNQKVNVEGYLTLGDDPPKEVLKRNKEKGFVKEDCVLEDINGSSTIHIWDHLLSKLESGKSYRFQNLSVKNYSGITLLGTTPTTIFKETDLQLNEVKGTTLLSNTEREIVIEEFKFVDKVSVFMICQISSCKKKMPHAVGVAVFKCLSCGTTQKVKAAEKGMSARLSANIDGKDLWLTAFTSVMEAFLSRMQLSNSSTTDQIAEALLGLENVKLKINTQSNHIIELMEE